MLGLIIGRLPKGKCFKTRLHSVDHNFWMDKLNRFNGTFVQAEWSRLSLPQASIANAMLREELRTASSNESCLTEVAVARPSTVLCLYRGWLPRVTDSSRPECNGNTRRLVSTRAQEPAPRFLAARAITPKFRESSNSSLPRCDLKLLALAYTASHHLGHYS